VLGLRHEDIAAAEREISIVARENANGARAKSGGRTVPVGGELIRLYAGYLHGEYGSTDSDYVFINVWAEPRGQAWSYPAVYDLVSRLRTRIGLHFDPHWFRHSAATRWQGCGVASDATFRGWREGGVAGPAALRSVRRACGRAAGHAVDQGFLAAGCGGCQDVASESVALDDRWLHLASRVEGAVWGQCGGRWRWWLPMARCRFRPGAALLEEMLAGWRRQQQARRLTIRLIGERERVVRQFAAYTGCWPWQWSAAQAETWVASGGWAHSTVRSYQGALALFLEYVCDPRYGWVSECEQRAGAVPVQVFHERNTAAHVSGQEGRPEQAAADPGRAAGVLRRRRWPRRAGSRLAAQGLAGGVPRRDAVQGGLRVGAAAAGGGDAGCG
jgi:Phage integrase family